MLGRNCEGSRVQCEQTSTILTNCPCYIMVLVRVVVTLAFGLLFEGSCSHTAHYCNTTVAIAIEAVLNMRSHGALVVPSIDPTRFSDYDGPTN